MFLMGCKINEVILLGTGVTIPSKDRNAPGVLVNLDDGTLFLFDCGNGILRQIAKADVDFSKIDNIFITHLHLDHTSDIGILVKANWLQGRQNTTLNCYGPKGTKQMCDLFFSKAYPYLEDVIPLEVTDVTPGIVLENEHYRISCFPLTHGVSSLAYKVETEENMIVVCGDTYSPVKGLSDFSKNADLLIHEVSFPDDYPYEKKDHTKPAPLGREAEEAGIKTLVLTHMYPACAGKEAQMVKSIKESYTGEVIIGEDLLAISLAKKSERS
jgi:ribonuclease BN (tRNA processing enzyme)